MNNNIKFSIMTPVYKVERYLPECIESVLGQTYGNFEFILVDDGSPDHSGEICEEYAKKDSRIRVFHKPNGGLMHTRRYALERAQGDYYVFLDSDDYLRLDTLETLHRYISETGVDCVIYGFEWLRPEGTSHIKCSSYDCGRVITDKRELYNIVFNDEAYNSLCRKCAKASCFDGRDHSARYHIRNGEDLVQSLEIIENARSAVFIPEMLYRYRYNPKSITHSKEFDNYSADFEVNEMVLEFLKRTDVLSSEDFDRLRNSSLDKTAVEIKRICRYASTREYKRSAIASIRESAFYAEFLKDGYRPVALLPGQYQPDALRRVLNRLTAKLLKKHRYDAIININTLLYCAAKAVGAR